MNSSTFRCEDELTARKAHVVGGGIGGLAVAACLGRAGWAVTVHERSGELREIGAGIYLKENSLRVLEHLGWLDKTLRHANRVRNTFINDRPGHELRRVAYGDERVYTILREDLHRELAEAAIAHGAQVALNSQVRQVTRDGSLNTDDKHHQCDLIVGADGVGSLVRQQAGLELSAQRLSSGSTRLLVPRLPGDTIDTSGEYWRGHNRVLVGPISESIVYMCCSSREDDIRGVAMPLDVDYWSSLFPELSSLFERVTTGVHHVHPRVKVSGWCNGRIAILGDAAHGQPPNLGQGAGMAIWNGYCLSQSLEQHSDVPEALAAWESSHRKLTDQVQNWSLGWEHVMHRWPRLLLGLRPAFVVALAKNRSTGRYWQGLYRGLGSQP